MTQEELAQLKVLLNKAKEALPGAEEFFVYENEDGTLTLRGDGTYVHNGNRTISILLPDGTVEKSEQLIY
jgi:hypothetical protein